MISIFNFLAYCLLAISTILAWIWFSLTLSFWKMPLEDGLCSILMVFRIYCIDCSCSNFKNVCLFLGYRKLGWLWTDFHYFHKYLHNNELNSRFYMGISKYHVRVTHIIHTQLQPVVTFWFWNINCWTLFKINPVFGVTWDTRTYMVFESNTASVIQNDIVCDLLWTRSKSLTQRALFIACGCEIFFFFFHQIWKVWPPQNWQIFSVFQKNT